MHAADGTPSPTGARSARFAGVTGWAETTLLLATLVLAWELVARAVLAEAYALAAPSRIALQLAGNWELYARNLGATAWTALRGFAIGNFLAILAAVLIVTIPVLERPIFSAALAIYALPIIALAPILMVLLDREAAMVALSALAVIFTTLVAAALGLRSADPAALDVVHVLGGSAWDKLVRVQVPAALPSLFAGLRIAAPAAVLGATVGEFMGAERGLGVLITNALADLETVRVWTVAVLATMLSTGGYLLIGWTGRRLTPWAREMEIVQAADRSGAAKRSDGSARRIARLAGILCVNLLVVFGGWALFIHLAGLNGFFAKGPVDVWEFLFVVPDAAANRQSVFGGLPTTVGNAVLGFLAGMTGGTVVAILFVLRPSVERAAMPVAIALRSIPILATTPLVILLFGRNLAATTTIVAILSFFPTLINLVVAMGLTRRSITDLLRVLNADRWTILWRAELPSALPALMASARIAVPSSILGAVIVEWLITGVGMGNAILSGVYHAEYAILWSVAVVLTLLSMTAYGLISLAERAVMRRFAPEYLQ